MDKNDIIIVILVIVVTVLATALIANALVSEQNNRNNNDTWNNTTNTTNMANKTNETVTQSQKSENNQYSNDSPASKSTSQETYQNSHSDWVCEGDTWYSKKFSDGNYALYDKSTGRWIGGGDMPDRLGYHDQNYLDKYSSSVKYRRNGEYYEG